MFEIPQFTDIIPTLFNILFYPWCESFLLVEFSLFGQGSGNCGCESHD